MNHKDLGLFGYGRLGRFLSTHLADDFPFRICDPMFSGETPQGQPFVSSREAAGCSIVLLAVPISSMEETCQQIAEDLRPGQLVLDTCSVKVLPLEIMSRYIPAGVDVVGTHPLFGPDSASDGLAGHKVVLCPLAGDAVLKVRSYLQHKGLRVIQCTPEKHDKAMAETQCVFHLIARAVKELGIEVGKISTPGPARLHRDFSVLQHDTIQLFVDMQNLNPYAGKIRKKLIHILQRIDNDLEK